MCGSWLIGRRFNGWGILRRCPCCTRLNRLDATIRYVDIYIVLPLLRNGGDSFYLSWNFQSIGSAEEMQQSEGVQSVAQERGEVHENLSNVSGHLSVDGQDRDTKQSHRQRRRCARMRGRGGRGKRDRCSVRSRSTQPEWSVAAPTEEEIVIFVTAIRFTSRPLFLSSLQPNETYIQLEYANEIERNSKERKEGRNEGRRNEERKEGTKEGPTTPSQHCSPSFP